MKKIILLLLLTGLTNLFAENNFISIDTVYNFSPGSDQNNGQSSLYYPANIFGLPYELADTLVPVSSPEDLLSIGLNGEITIGFKNYKIIDKPGIDFIIYENVMWNRIEKKYFVEPAQVSVSYDGINFIAFPFDSATLKGCAGISPTKGKMVNIDILASGGDGFDIADLGLKEIKYIKIKDITEILKDPNHYYHDPTISGFDLDAVVGINHEKIFNSIADNISSHFASLKDIISQNPNAQLAFYNILGEKQISSKCKDYEDVINQLPNGNYIVIIKIDNSHNEYFKIKI